MNTKKISKLNFRHLILMAGFAMILFLFISKAKADPTDYIYSNYGGVTNSNTTMYTQPGSEKPPVLDPDGNPLRVPAGTEVFITGEQKDKDLDVWYQSKITINGIEYEGFLFTGRVNRGEKIEFTPTPVPTDTPTPVPEVTNVINPDPVSPDEVTPADSENNNKQLIDESKGLEPWRWIIILIIVIVAFMLIYTIWVKKNEERLEREIERYSGKETYQKIDGESDEDFAEAKSNYYDSFNFGDKTGTRLVNAVNDNDDLKVDVSDIFEEESSKRKARFSEDATLTELLADLEGRMAKDKKNDDFDENVDDSDEASEIDEEELEDEEYEADLEEEADDESDDAAAEDELEDEEIEYEDEEAEYDDEAEYDEAEDAEYDESEEDLEDEAEYDESEEEYEDEAEYDDVNESEDEAEYDESEEESEDDVEYDESEEEYDEADYDESEEEYDDEAEYDDDAENAEYDESEEESEDEAEYDESEEESEDEAEYDESDEEFDDEDEYEEYDADEEIEYEDDEEEFEDSDEEEAYDDDFTDDGSEVEEEESEPEEEVQDEIDELEELTGKVEEALEEENGKGVVIPDFVKNARSKKKNIPAPQKTVKEVEKSESPVLKKSTVPAPEKAEKPVLPVKAEKPSAPVKNEKPAVSAKNEKAASTVKTEKPASAVKTEKSQVSEAKKAEKASPEKKKSKYSELFEDEEDRPRVKMSPRDYLDNLNENDILNHKIYGKGTVVDNFSPEVIQVDFGGNVKYLKKDKLVKKDLIIL